MSKPKKIKDAGDLVTGKRRRSAFDAEAADASTETKQDAPTEGVDEKVAYILELIDGLDSVGLCLVLRHTEQALRPRTRASLASEPIWYHQVSTMLGSIGVVCLPFSALSGSGSLVAPWRRACLSCQTYVDQCGATSPAAVTRGRDLVLKCVLGWMQKCNIPITFKTYVQQMANVSTAMESSFPGYRASGLLRALLNRKE